MLVGAEPRILRFPALGTGRLVNATGNEISDLETSSSLEL
jgi:hypothetical protein